MKIVYYFIFSLVIMSPAFADNDSSKPTGKIISILKNSIIHSVSHSMLAQELSKLPDSERLVQKNQYQGQKVFYKGQLYGLVRFTYANDKPVLAAFISPPMRLRDTTKRTEHYQQVLSEKYKEIEHNRYDLGNNIIARIIKKQREVSIVVSRNKL